MSIFVERTKVLKISFFAIISAFLVEITFGFVANSLGLITDSMHALLDSIVTIILLLAARMALKPPDAEHTYGHGKIESLGGLIGGIAILLIAVFFIYESVTRMQSSETQTIPSLVGLVAGTYTIGIDVFRIWILKRSIKKIGGTTLKADLYHAFMDFGSTMVAILGILLASFGFQNSDFFAALILGIVLAILSLKLIHRSALELTDVISPVMVTQVRKLVERTPGVVDVGPILMRRSGDIIFADITISLRGDVSFDKAHLISEEVEKNIQKEINNAAITIHFEPSWKNIPLDAKITEIASGVSGVKGVHNTSSYTSMGKTYVNLHVMVDSKINLEQAHQISEEIEDRIKKEIGDIEHVTIHLEPFVVIPKDFNVKGKSAEEKVRTILAQYPEIKKIGRIVVLHFNDIIKIEIDCSFDKDMSIEKVHDMTSKIERRIKGYFKDSIITIHPEPH